MDDPITLRFWYLNHAGLLEYRKVEWDTVHYLEDPGYDYAPGWFMSGYDVDREDGGRAYRSFSLDLTRVGFASPTHWTDRGNNSPVLNCAKAFGVSYATALHVAHQKTYGTPLPLVGMDKTMDEVIAMPIDLRGLFLGHLDAVANTLLAHRRRVA